MTRTQRWTLAVVSAATAMLMLDIAVVNTALPRIAEDLDTGLSGLQWVVDAYTLALASVVLSAGFLADRFGRRRLFTIGLIIFTATSLVAGFAGDITVLNTARAVQGIGAAIMFAVSLALLAHAFPEPKERAGALAVYGATIGASFAVGPLAGGALTSALDWGWVFLINIPIGLASLWITRTHVEESRDPAPRKIDVPGQITLAGGLFLLVLALLRGNEQGWGSTPIVAELTAAAVLLIAFVVIQKRVREPMLPLGLFRNGDFTGAQIAAFAISASLFAVFLYVTLYLQQILGLTPVEAGLVYIPGTIVNLVVAGATASMLDRVSARLLIGVGLVLVAVGPGAHGAARHPGLLVGGAAAGLHHRDGRHGHVQPGGVQRRAELGPRRAERPGGRRERHVPPGGHRRRRRGAGRARARRRGVRRGHPGGLRGRHERGAAGRRRARRRRRGRRLRAHRAAASATGRSSAVRLEPGVWSRRRPA